jgi:hypothetical protein
MPHGENENPVKPSPNKPLRLVLAVILFALAGGVLVVFLKRPPAEPVAHTTLHMEVGGASVQFPVSLDTQQASDAGNWTASAVGSSAPLSVKAASIGTDDRSVFLEIFGLQPDMQLKVRYKVRSAAGAELHGTLTGKVDK